MGSPPPHPSCVTGFLTVPTHALPHLPGQPCAGRSLQLTHLPGQLALWGWRETLRTAASDGFLVLKAFHCPSSDGQPQQKPAPALVVDVPGSMYRFNGVDGRLERSMEAVCMVMEAFENYEEKFKVTV